MDGYMQAYVYNTSTCVRASSILSVYLYTLRPRYTPYFFHPMPHNPNTGPGNLLYQFLFTMIYMFHNPKILMVIYTCISFNIYHFRKCGHFFSRYHM